MAMKTVLSTTPDWVTVTPCILRSEHQHSLAAPPPSYLGESLAGIERGEESEGDPGDEDSPADEEEINDVLHLHVEL